MEFPQEASRHLERGKRSYRLEGIHFSLQRGMSMSQETKKGIRGNSPLWPCQFWGKAAGIGAEWRFWRSAAPMPASCWNQTTHLCHVSLMGRLPWLFSLKRFMQLVILNHDTFYLWCLGRVWWWGGRGRRKSTLSASLKDFGKNLPLTLNQRYWKNT